MNDIALNDLKRLMLAGWKLGELDRLFEFLRTHAKTDEDRSETETRHLEFLRYLVQTGRLVS